MALARNLKKFWVFYLMMLPGIAFLLLNNYIPIAGVLIAFKKIKFSSGSFIDSFLSSPWVGFRNFKYLFLTNDAWIITRNTLLYNTLFIFLNLVVPIAFAVLLNEMKNKFFAKAHQSILFLPYFLSMIMVSYLVYGFLNETNGFINRTIMDSLGLEAVNWYFKKEVWPYILPLVNTWKNVGYYTVIYFAAIVGFDDEYYEAATIDGASKWQQFKSITVPLLAPMMIVMTLLQIGRIFYADFGLFFQVPRESGALFPVTNVVDTYVYRTFLTLGDIGLSSAAGLYQSLVGFVLVFISNWFVRRIDKDSALF